MVCSLNFNYFIKNFNHFICIIKKYLTFAAQFNLIDMAHHKSAKKRIRQDAKKRIYNKYYKKSTRTFIQNLRSIEDKEKAAEFLPKVISMIDKLVKKNLWHKNKGANLKRKLTHFVNNLGD